MLAALTAPLCTSFRLGIWIHNEGRKKWVEVGKNFIKVCLLEVSSYLYFQTSNELFRLYFSFSSFKGGRKKEPKSMKRKDKMKYV